MKKDCYNYVNLKYAVDDKLQQQVDANTISRKGYLAAVNPLLFVIKTLPFSTAEIISGSLVSTQVDPFSVVGGTYDDYSSEDISAKHCEIVNEGAKMKQISTDSHYLQIGGMPLYMAIERKNRVQLFRKFNIPINCNVETVKYPKASELKIHEVSFRKNLFFVSCSNNDFFRGQYQSIKYDNHKFEGLRDKGYKEGNHSRKFRQIDYNGHTGDSLVQVVFPQYILPLLLKYGVEYGKKIMRPFSTHYEGKIIKCFSEHGYRMS